VRIVAGSWRGRPIRAPEGRDLRPTADRVREAVFNTLTHGGKGAGGADDVVRGARVLDGFAGTGALGLEAVSRGAAHATLMERDPAALEVCRGNVRALGAAAHVTVLGGDCTQPVRSPEPCSLVFLDAPYNSGLSAPALEALAAANWIADGAICVVELAAKEAFDAPDGAELLDERRYGAARVVYLRWAGATALGRGR
jgi:16S rRNA (guanine966-N2)-methyltransferase